MLFNYYKTLLFCLLILFNSGCGRFVQYEPDKNKRSNTSSKNVIHHSVKAGETLYSIAFEYGRDHRDVARWNQIQEPYTIYPKQKLRVIPIDSDEVNTKQNAKVESQHSTVAKSEPIENKTQYVSNSELIWQWPTRGNIESTFSIRDPGRRGIDIVGRKGQPVHAAAGGRVVYSGNGLRGYGNLIILKHNDTFFSAYAHTDDVVVKENQIVKLGQKLADMSNTSSEKTKLHFEIRRDGKPVNPLKYLPKRR